MSMDAPDLAVRLMSGEEITEQERDRLANLLIAGAAAMHKVTGISPDAFPDPVDKMMTYGEHAAAWKHVREPLELLLDGAS